AFYTSMGGNLRIQFIKIDKLKPRIMFVETYKLTTIPGDYGAGKTIKTFALLIYLKY
ncbi:unnamed protein product, partial [marine sediment metagenome]